MALLYSRTIPVPLICMRNYITNKHSTIYVWSREESKVDCFVLKTLHATINQPKISSTIANVYSFESEEQHVSICTTPEADVMGGVCVGTHKTFACARASTPRLCVRFPPRALISYQTHTWHSAFFSVSNTIVYFNEEIFAIQTASLL